MKTLELEPEITDEAIAKIEKRLVHCYRQHLPPTRGDAALCGYVKKGKRHGQPSPNHARCPICTALSQP